MLLSVRNGRFTRIGIGRNYAANLCRRIAQSLGLPNAENFTGHALRASGVCHVWWMAVSTLLPTSAAATALAGRGGTSQQVMWLGGWKSRTVSDGYVRESLRAKQVLICCSLCGCRC